MPTINLPPDNHIVRYARKRLLRRDDGDNVIGILPQALEHRDGEAYLSVTWLEHFASDYEQGLFEAAEAVRRQLTVKPRDAFAVGGVDTIHEICESFGARVRIVHEPVPPENTGHSAMRRLPRENMELLALLASDAFIDTRVANTFQQDD